MNTQTQEIPLNSEEISKILFGKSTDSIYSAFINATDMQKTSYEIQYDGNDQDNNSFGQLIEV